MDLRVAQSRALYLLFVLCNAAAMFGAGAEKFGGVLVGLAPLFVGRAAMLSAMPPLVRNARWLLLRPIIVWELAGLAGFAVGARTGTTLGCSFMLWGPALGILLAYFASRGAAERLPVVSRGFFLFARGHFDDYSARRHVAAIFVLTGLVSAALTLQLDVGPYPDDYYAQRSRAVVVLTAVAMLVTSLQVNPVRGTSFLPFGLLALVIGTLGFALDWADNLPSALIGVGAGLSIAGPTTGILMLVPPRQRLAAMLVAGAAVWLGIYLGIYISALPLARAVWLLTALSVGAFALFLWLYFREFAEFIQEWVHWPMYRFRSYGPGRYLVPTRGPVLVISNHGAYFDPLFLAKVLPLRLRAWMISTMFDKPFLKWLAGDVYGAVRVPDRPGFRRHMPEIDQAIAILKNGENMMIFPEAWLRRKEEQPIHRFAQGIYHILKACPTVVVLPAWVEDSWGSYLSYKNGPPTKGKPFDWFYRIRMGFGEPQVLPPELLEDHRATRRYLMERVLHCRTYLGLPAHPVPGLTGVDDEKE
jgi:1-acyl-sn-glycerol-3-phosphate acyltransferase